MFGFYISFRLNNIMLITIGKIVGRTKFNMITQFMRLSHQTQQMALVIHNYI